MQNQSIFNTKSNAVICEGFCSPYDHPKIYLYIDDKIGSIRCPYCSKHFQLIKN
ncbi:zinc-finger domain-containing protein [Rickettsia endosymbiont of Cardiosporidium cionae]|uniref:zinc-finger domain-containing protein n=1 Tax=Rickettsia endosymbiont of Cardiosporidium cionae TaxID=2777155 RepID=UPI001894A69A|nr:zinc-finger domain-containing protein [Rickettsia endosymbiont of Cardiosporidium cionae]KAF8818996.1 zinc-finger domain-containing protein [Rickettsia endosymbiont of Cardiosporidium cionae]